MIKYKYIHIYELFSILFFSILANYLFELKIDFSARIDIYKIFKLFCLTLGSFTFYFFVYPIQEIKAQSIREYENERKNEVKAKRPIAMYFDDNVALKRKKLIYKLFISMISIVMFFIFEPILKLIWPNN